MSSTRWGFTGRKSDGLHDVTILRQSESSCIIAEARAIPISICISYISSSHDGQPKITERYHSHPRRPRCSVCKQTRSSSVNLRDLKYVYSVDQYGDSRFTPAFRANGPEERLDNIDVTNPDRHVYSRYTQDVSTRAEHILSKVTVSQLNVCWMFTEHGLGRTCSHLCVGIGCCLLGINGILR